MISLENLTVIRDAFPRTVRLVATANKRPAVLLSLVPDEDLAALAEIEGATSTRLVAQERGAPDLPPQELVFGIPHAAFINAAFAYAKPLERNRFNGPNRGAWYAALDVHTCLAEVAYHMTEFLGRTGQYKAEVEYVEIHASLAGEFLDLRPHGAHASLSRDVGSGYLAGNALADEVRGRGLNGIIYPSVRQEVGTCFAVLWPYAVQSVAQGASWRLTWIGEAAPKIEPL